MKQTFSCQSFDQLSLSELYEILQFRQEVFIVEQTCPYLDADGKDQASLHVLGRNVEGKLIAYARIVPKGISYKNYASIGRVISALSYRGKGLGYALMAYTIVQTKQHNPAEDIKISAQNHLLEFYVKLGFEPVGDVYLEDDIPHRAMILKC